MKGVSWDEWNHSTNIKEAGEREYADARRKSVRDTQLMFLLAVFCVIAFALFSIVTATGGKGTKRSTPLIESNHETQSRTTSRPLAVLVRMALSDANVTMSPEFQRHDSWAVALWQETIEHRTRASRTNWALDRFRSLGITGSQRELQLAAGSLVNEIEKREVLERASARVRLSVPTQKDPSNGRKPVSLPTPLEVYEWCQAEWDRADNAGQPIPERGGFMFVIAGRHFGISTELAKELYYAGAMQWLKDTE